MLKARCLDVDAGTVGLTFLTGYVLGQHGAQSAKLASDVAHRSAWAVGDLADLHARVDRLVLVVDAMWSLLEESGYSDDDLLERIDRIDRSDGERDGRRTPRAADCGGCGSKVAAGLTSCQFCGADVAPGSVDPLGAV